MAVGSRLAAADRLSTPGGEPALHAIADAAVDGLAVAAASIALHDPATGRLVFRAAAGPQGGGVVGLSVAAHEGIAGYAFATGQALAVADVTADPRFERSTAERTGYVPRSLLAVPLVDDAGIAGVMELLDRRDGQPFDLADVELATRFAAAVTVVARTSHLDRDALGLLRNALVALATNGDAADGNAADGNAPDGDAADGGRLDPAAMDALLEAASDGLAGDDPLWRLADRIARLRAAEPDDLDLAVDWLDALLARTERRALAGRRRPA